jgi:PilZ domain
MEDQNQINRSSILVGVDLKCTKPVIEKTIFTKDLSKSGLCFELDKPIDISNKINLGLSLILGPDAQSEVVYINAEVAWCFEEEPGQYQIGAKFEDLDEEKDLNIETFLDYLHKSELEQ